MWRVPRPSSMGWTCRRCGALLQANPVRMKISNWMDRAVGCALLVWFIFLSNGGWTSFVRFVAISSIVHGLIEFAGRGVRLVHSEKGRMEYESGDFPDDRRGTSPALSGRMKYRRCPNCGRFQWSLWRWSWARGITTRWNCSRCGTHLQPDPDRNAICGWSVSAVFLLWILMSLGFNASFWYGASFWSIVAGFVIVSAALCLTVAGVQIARSEEDRVACETGDPAADTQSRRCPNCGNLARGRRKWSWERGLWTQWSCPRCGVPVQSASSLTLGA